MRTPPIYVINLDRDVERMASLNKNLSELGLPYERVSAVLGKEVPDWEKLVDAPLYARRNSKSMAVPGEIGCTLSHMKVLELFLSTDAPWCVVLEDDVWVQPACAEVLRALDERSDWDLVKLFCFHGGLPVTVGSLSPTHRLAVPLTRTTSSAAYAVNRRGAEILLQTLLPMSEQVDHAMDRPWESGLRIRLVRPLPVRLAPIAKKSTIKARDRRSKTKPPLGRYAQLFCTRAGKEARRFFHAIGEVLRARD